uniref:Uncharacterized protein n=1 Tax=Yamagishiella unicocca TaxID=51707 RepID=A0A1W6R6M6_9CHLO|nr:hypothetical protein [Yamagishiella unicocca]
MGEWIYQGVFNVGVQIMVLVFSGWCFARFGLLSAEPFMGQINVLILRLAFPTLTIYLLGLKLDLRDAEVWRSLGAYVLWVGLVQVGIVAYTWMREGRTTGDAGLLNLVLTANNTVIVGLPVMEATFPDVGGKLSLLTVFVLFLQVIPFSITAFEVERWMVEDHAAQRAAATAESEPPPTPDRDLSGRWVTMEDGEEERCPEAAAAAGAACGDRSANGGGGAAAAAGVNRVRWRHSLARSSGSSSGAGGGGVAVRGRPGRRRIGSGMVVGPGARGWAPATPSDSPGDSREGSGRMAPADVGVSAGAGGGDAGGGRGAVTVAGGLAEQLTLARGLGLAATAAAALRSTEPTADVDTPTLAPLVRAPWVAVRQDSAALMAATTEATLLPPPPPPPATPSMLPTPLTPTPAPRGTTAEAEVPTMPVSAAIASGCAPPTPGSAALACLERAASSGAAAASLSFAPLGFGAGRGGGGASAQVETGGGRGGGAAESSSNGQAGGGGGAGLAGKLRSNRADDHASVDAGAERIASGVLAAGSRAQEGGRGEWEAPPLMSCASFTGVQERVAVGLGPEGRGEGAVGAEGPGPPALSVGSAGPGGGGGGSGGQQVLCSSDSSSSSGSSSSSSSSDDGGDGRAGAWERQRDAGVGGSVGQPSSSGATTAAATTTVLGASRAKPPRPPAGAPAAAAQPPAFAASAPCSSDRNALPPVTRSADVHLNGAAATAATAAGLFTFPSAHTAAMRPPSPYNARAGAPSGRPSYSGPDGVGAAAAHRRPKGRSSVDHARAGAAAAAGTGYSHAASRPVGHRLSGPGVLDAGIQRRSFPVHWPPVPIEAAANGGGGGGGGTALASSLCGSAAPSPPLSRRLFNPVAIACPDLPIPQATNLARAPASGHSGRVSYNGYAPARSAGCDSVVIGDGSTRPSGGRHPSPSEAAAAAAMYGEATAAAPPVPNRALVRAAAGSMTRRHGGIASALGRWLKLQLVQHRRVWLITWVVLKNPLLWSLLVALLVNLSGLRGVLYPGSSRYRPELGWVAGSLAWSSSITVPVSLFSNGVWLHGKTFGRPTLLRAGGLLLLKLLLLGPLQLACAAVCGLAADAGISLLLLALCPVASTSFVIASQYGHGADIVTAITVLGIVLLVPVVLVALTLPRALGLYSYQVATS